MLEKKVILEGKVSEDCDGMLLPGGLRKKAIWPELIGKFITITIEWKEEKKNV